MSFKIFPTLSDFERVFKGEDEEETFHYGTAYIEMEQLEIRVFQNSFIVRDIAPAMKSGKKLMEHTLVDRDVLKEYYGMEDYIFDTYRSLQEYVELAFADELKDLPEEFTTKRQFIKAKDVFSPFAQLNNVNTKAKWTIDKVVRAILTGQAVKGHIKRQFTDDYARDASLNFREGMEMNLLLLAQELTESPSGWHVDLAEQGMGYQVLSVRCHHFDYRTVYINE